jgi:hypothetical protein
MSPPAALTQYPGSRTITAVFAGGDATLSADMPVGTTTLTNGYLVSSVQVHNTSTPRRRPTSSLPMESTTWDRPR